ncbi:uncharacterized protein EHS24_002498 [Apiotrichum porosum]|uniref:Uncharacterized protein n=1 Tax=Apiotrichum porosum TaxID=105984 RepID=A0A427XH03_9TREE|nr:uncharacterized protein EHS24_002498 [Apiotrichum porosum]RSH78043.1 hypothetical protein EHS24_002498 [Apiotrichum porosum]
MSLFNPQPHIRQRQIALQNMAGKEFVYLRKPGSKPMFAAYMALFTVGVVGNVFQLVQYARGKATKVGE